MGIFYRQKIFWEMLKLYLKNMFFISMSNDKQWVLTMAWKEMKTDCKFTIGTVTFDCAKKQDEKQPMNGGLFIVYG